MAKLVFVSNEDRIHGILTKIFTGSYIYHVGWLDEESGLFYDMHLLRRRRKWPRYKDSKIEMFDFPEVTGKYLEHQLTNDTSSYGFIDYLLFGLRPFYHLIGRSTRNAGGQICSEACNVDLLNHGFKTGYRATDAPPSPVDLYKWCKTR